MTEIGIALAVATGGEFAGDKVVDAGPVLIVNPEDDGHEQARRLMAAVEATGADPELIGVRVHFAAGSLLIARKDEGFKPSGMALGIANDARTLGAALVIIDPLIEVHDANENQNEEMRAVVAVARVIAQNGNCSVLLIHHTGKNYRAGEMEAARGASSIAGVLRFIRTLTELDDDDRRRANLPVSEHGGYVVLMDAKANYAAMRSGGFVMERRSVRLPNGDNVGVLAPIDGTGWMDQLKPNIPVDTSERDKIAKEAAAIVTDQAMSVSELAGVILERHPDWFPNYKPAKEYQGKFPGGLRDKVEAAILSRRDDEGYPLELVQAGGDGVSKKRFLVRLKTPVPSTSQLSEG